MWRTSASYWWIWNKKTHLHPVCTYFHCKTVHISTSWLVLPVVDKESVFVYLVLQSEVEGEVFNTFITVYLHFGGIIICLKVFDDIREPDWQTIIPATTTYTGRYKSLDKCWRISWRRRRVAQWIEPWCSDEGVTGSNPTAVSMSLCPWARHFTSNCSCGDCPQYWVCKSLWIKASNE